MTFYPKHLFGPSSNGSAQARALAMHGGAYQWSQRDSGTVVRQQGDFQRVLIGGVEYVTSGRMRTGGDTVSVETSRYQSPFRPGISSFGQINLGQGQYMAGAMGERSRPQLHYSYTVYAGGTFGYSEYQNRGEAYVYNTSYYGSERLLGGVNWVGSNPVSSTPTQGLYLNQPGIAYAGAIEGPPADKVAFMPFLADTGRQDGVGRMLPSPVVATWRRNGEPDTRTMNPASFTRPDAEFCEIMKEFATDEHAGFIMAELFFRAEITAPGIDYRPRFWLGLAANKSFSSLGAANVTALAFPGGSVPTPEPAIGGENPRPEHYQPNSGRFYNVRLTYMMELLQLVVLPGNVVLAMFPQYCGSATAGTERWHARIVRMVVSAGGVTGAMVEDDPGALSSLMVPSHYIQHAVHLGEGWVLAKKVYGFMGINYPVAFMLSTDGGLTWEEFAPAGFDAELQNQYFGDFTVHEARDASKEAPGVVLTQSWNPATQTVHVYSSADAGRTWQRRGQIAKPESFQRIDAMLAGDGGANFMRLLPGPSPLRPVDVTNPDRYKA